MKLLIADAFPTDVLPRIEGLGYEVTHQPSLTAEELPGAIAGFDVLVVRSTKVTAETIEASDGLSLVLRAGAGTNTIDKAAAAAQGIFVSNVPGKNAIAVAELTMGLLLSLDRRIPDNVRDSRDGVWRKKAYGKAEGIAGRTLGIIGMGQIGMAVAERAAAFGLKVVTTAKQRPEATERRLDSIGVVSLPSLEDVLRTSDIVSLHVPAAPGTEGMVDAAFLSEMKAGAWLINTSRGEVVDEDALLEAIEAKGLRVAIDVFADEPKVGEGTFASTLAQHPSVYTTHHIGASTEQAQQAVADGVVSVLASFSHGTAQNVVNLTSPEPVGAILVVRHYDRVGVLSRVLDKVREVGLNVQEMSNQPFAGAGAAVASIHVVGELPDGLRERLEEIDDVIHCTVRGLR